jgi:hypothetical protein
LRDFLDPSIEIGIGIEKYGNSERCDTDFDPDTDTEKAG